MHVILLNEGTALFVDHIVSIGPRFYLIDAAVAGTAISCTDGQTYVTEESMDDFVQRIAEMVQS